MRFTAKHWMKALRTWYILIIFWAMFLAPLSSPEPEKTPIFLYIVVIVLLMYVMLDIDLAITHENSITK